MLSTGEVDKILHAAKESAFPEFWAALIEAVRQTGMSPLTMLGRAWPVRVAMSGYHAVATLRGIECPFDLLGSPWGTEAMLGAFRVIAARAGVAEAAELEFSDLGRVI
ncbi:MAG: hypothetical protein WC114_11035 [Smithellaceae bacterium]